MICEHSGLYIQKDPDSCHRNMSKLFPKYIPSDFVLCIRNTCPNSTIPAVINSCCLSDLLISFFVWDFYNVVSKIKWQTSWGCAGETLGIFWLSSGVLQILHWFKCSSSTFFQILRQGKRLRVVIPTALKYYPHIFFLFFSFSKVLTFSEFMEAILLFP